MKELATGLQNKEIDSVRKRAISAIRTEAGKANREARLDIPYRFHKLFKEEFESKGYHVNCGDEQRDGSWFHVSW
jgi:hypothetical protein